MEPTRTDDYGARSVSTCTPHHVVDGLPADAVHDDTSSMRLAPHPTTSDSHAEGSPEALEFWIALAAGEPVWADPDDEVSPIERMAASIELFALATCITIIWTGALMRGEPSTGFTAVAPWLATTALLFMMVRPVRLVLEFRRQAQLWPSFAARVDLITITVASMMPSSPMFGLMSMWPLAVALGIEAALCSWALGFNVEPVRWWTNFLRSPLHMGVVGGVAASVLYLGISDAAATVIPIYVVINLCVLGSASVALLLDRFRTDLDERRHEEVSAAAAAEHRQSAHWLHDDVSAELKLIELKLRNGSFESDDVAAALSELDHHLRLRQLDELYQSGTVRLAEILQPFVRNAQSRGISITAVPTFDDASAIVDERLGRLFGRAVAVTAANAMLAGAAELGFVVHSDDTSIVLSVSDDAGGFDLASVPAGRGLWQLGQELGSANISVEPCGKGSTVTVVMRRHLGDTRANLGAGSVT